MSRGAQHATDASSFLDALSVYFYVRSTLPARLERVLNLALGPGVGTLQCFRRKYLRSTAFWQRISLHALCGPGRVVVEDLTDRKARRSLSLPPAVDKACLKRLFWRWQHSGRTLYRDQELCNQSGSLVVMSLAAGESRSATRFCDRVVGMRWLGNRHYVELAVDDDYFRGKSCSVSM